MDKFGTFEIDTSKIIAVRWVHVRLVDPLKRKWVTAESPSSVIIYTTNHRFVLEGGDFEAYCKTSS